MPDRSFLNPQPRATAGLRSISHTRRPAPRQPSAVHSTDPRSGPNGWRRTDLGSSCAAGGRMSTNRV